jgi:predicted nucleotidyltransferase
MILKQFDVYPELAFLFIFRRDIMLYLACMMTSMEQIKDFTKRVVVQFQPMRVLLFGSYARGEQSDDSDVDLLIIMPFSGRPAAKGPRKNKFTF